MKLLGDTAADRKRSVGLLIFVAWAWPLMVAATAVEKVGTAYCTWRLGRGRPDR
jgi:hypothetical protein